MHLPVKDLIVERIPFFSSTLNVQTHQALITSEICELIKTKKRFYECERRIIRKAN